MGIANQLVPKGGRSVAAFEPKLAKKRNAQGSAVIDYAKRVKDWPLLEEAIEQKLADQEEFVGWWRGAVSIGHGAGRGNKKNADRGSFSKEQAETDTGISQQQVSKWAKRLQDRDAYREALRGPTYRKAMAERGQTDQRGASGTGDNEWYTPLEYIELARQVLGTIELDPATSRQAQGVIKAEKFFTKIEDGLAHEWHGKVWLNPPFAQPHIAHFVSKLVAERLAARVTAAIMLTHNYTDTAWFHEAAGAAAAICFTRGRVKFHDQSGKLAAPTQGQAFFYFGQDIASFAEAFADVGFIVEPRR